jgi:hypothetical protein
VATAPTLPSVPAVKPTSRKPIMIGIASLAVVAGVLAVILVLKQPSTPKPAEPSIAATPTPTPGPAPAAAPAAPLPARVVGPAPVEAGKTVVQLVVETEPKGATVHLDGKRLGETPVAVEVSRADVGKLVVSKSGYESVNAALKLSDDARVSYTLEREQTRVSIKRQTKTTKPPAGTGAGMGSGSATPAKGDPKLEIKLTR